LYNIFTGDKMSCEYIDKQTEILKTDKLLRKVMFEVYDGKCFYTGRKLKFEDFDIDHIVPLSKDGKNNIENYVVSSPYINMKKNNKYDEDFVKVIKSINNLLFTDKVVSIYNTLKLNKSILDEMVDISDFIREKGFTRHNKKQNFSYYIQRKLTIMREHYITKNGAKSRKCKLFVDRRELEREFEKYDWE